MVQKLIKKSKQKMEEPLGEPRGAIPRTRLRRAMARPRMARPRKAKAKTKEQRHRRARASNRRKMMEKEKARPDPEVEAKETAKAARVSEKGRLLLEGGEGRQAQAVQRLRHRRPCLIDET